MPKYADVVSVADVLGSLPGLSPLLRGKLRHLFGRYLGLVLRFQSSYGMP